MKAISQNQLPKLDSIAMGYANMTLQGIEYFKGMNNSWRYLALGYNRIGVEGVRLLSEYINSTILSQLYL
jgi:hypothetical protein